MPKNLSSVCFLFIAVATCCVLLGGKSKAQSKKQTHQKSNEQSIPLQSTIDRVQPMTGIVLWNDHPKVDTDSVSLEFRYCGYNEVATGKDEFDFSKIDEILDDVASRNHQAILRFYFVYPGKKTTVPDFIRDQPGYRETTGKSEGKKTGFCDWSHQGLQDFTLQFYSQLAQKYDQDPRLAFLQVGFGLWSEYHIYDGPRKMGKTFPDAAFQTKFIKHLDRCFQHLPWSISVDAADSDYSPLEDKRELLNLQFGLFDDSFLCKSHAKENAVNWEILSPDRWKRQPAGGEFSYYTDHDQKTALSKNGPHGVSFESAARQFHISYMIGNDQPQYQSLHRIKAASLATGYRFRVTKATWQQEQLTLTVTNEGVAPIYRDAFFVAGDRRSKTSLKGLLPGKTRQCKIDQVKQSDLDSISIHSDFILSTQEIQFAADLK